MSPTINTAREPTRAAPISRLERAYRSACCCSTRAVARPHARVGARVSPRPHGRSRRGPPLLSRPGLVRFRCNFPSPRREGRASVRPKAHRARASRSTGSSRSTKSAVTGRRRRSGTGFVIAAARVARGCSRTRRSHRRYEQRVHTAVLSSGAGAYASHETVRGSCGAFRFRGRLCSRSARRTRVARWRPARGCTAPL